MCQEEKKECNLVLHARHELALLEASAAEGEDGPCEMQQQVTEDVLAVLRVLSDQNHSGSSIGYIMRLVNKLAAFGNLTPLTGSDDEWMEVGEGVFQSKRCPHVFKNAEGRAYDLDGYIGVDPNGSCWTGGEIPLCFIEFPYTPKRKYLPRFSLLPPIEDDESPREERVSEFLHSTAESVLEFYERNGIEQPPEEEHVVKLRGKLEYVEAIDVNGNPVQIPADIAEPIAEEPKL